VQEQLDAETVEDAINSFSDGVSSFLDEQFPRDQFDDAEKAAGFADGIGEALETFDTDNSLVSQMLEETDLLVQGGIMSHFGAGAFATQGPDGRSEVVLDPTQGINTPGYVAHEFTHALTNTAEYDTPPEASNHASSWSDDGLTFDSPVESYQLLPRQDIENAPDVEPSEEFAELANAANNVIAETKEAVDSGEIEDWDKSELVNSYEYAHTNASEVVSEAVRAFTSDQQRDNLQENWPELHDAVGQIINTETL